jgi:hypothetical protein
MISMTVMTTSVIVATWTAPPTQLPDTMSDSRRISYKSGQGTKAAAQPTATVRAAEGSDDMKILEPKDERGASSREGPGGE